MDIWIARDGKSYGPYDEQKIKRWISEGKISADDLAFRDGETNWVPLNQILSVHPRVAGNRAGQAPSRKSDNSTHAPSSARTRSAGPPTNARAGMSLLPEDFRVPYLYAGFWPRLAAYCLDGIIVGTSTVVLVLFIMLFLNALLPISHPKAVGIGMGLIIRWLYFALCESSAWEATPGKLALGFKVTDAAGKRIGFGSATVRYLGKLLSGFTLLIGHMMAGWTARKQAMHDFMACTVVVRKGVLAEFRELEASGPH